MSTISIVRQCSKRDCGVASSGTCSEGHSPLKSCPNYSESSHVDETVLTDELVDLDSDMSAKVESLIPLPLGETLAPSEVDVFLRWRPAKLITVVGDSFSGKTTFVAALYERYLKGAFADQRFAGSWTLVGFERCCHESRVNSGRLGPDTPRTSRLEGLKYFHLAIESDIDGRGRRTDLMISDRAGEVYKEARDNTALIRELPEVSGSDRLIILLDGDRLAEAGTRAQAMQSVRGSLRAFVDCQALGMMSRVQVVLTKMDKVVKHAEHDHIMKAVAEFQRRLKETFAGRLLELTFWEIAARDPTGTFAGAHGIDLLIRDWVKPEEPIGAVDSTRLQLSSEFDRLLNRSSAEHLQ